MLKLEFLSQSREGVWLVGESLTVGSDTGNDIVLHGKDVKRRHAVFAVEDGTVELINTAQGAVTRVNGQLADRAGPLRPGDIISIGEVELKIVEPEKQPQSHAPESAPPWRLVATGDWLAGQQFPIAGRVVLGRDASCNITIPGTHLSRRHAELELRDDVLTVKDLDSANGTFVNGERIERAELKPGDEIKFDVLTFRITGPENGQRRDATVIRPAVDSAATPPRSTEKAGPPPRQWQKRPTAVGNRDKTVHMTLPEKAAASLWPLLMITMGVLTLAALGWLLLQL